MKTRTDPRTKAKSISLEGYESKRIREALDVLLLFKNEAVIEAEQAIAALELFVVAMTPPKKAKLSETTKLPFKEAPGPLTPVRS